MLPDTPPRVRDFPGNTKDFLVFLKEQADAIDLSKLLRQQGEAPGDAEATLYALHRADGVKEFIEALIVEYEQQQAELRSTSSENPGGRFGEGPDSVGVSVRVES